MSLYGQRARRDPFPLLLRRVAFVLLCGLTVLVCLEAWDVYGKQRASAESRREVELKLRGLAEREAALRANIAALKTDRGLEEALRREYGVGKGGEGLIIIVEPERPPLPDSESWPVELLRQALPWW